MKMSLALLALCLATSAAAQVPEKVEPALLPNYTVMAPGVAGAGRPTADGLAALKAQGFRTVVDLSTSAEPGVAGEKGAVEAQGLRYVSVPVSPSTFSAADVDAVKAVLDDAAAGPVLVHCASANRVGAVWAVIQARSGMPIDDAIADGKRVGLASASMTEAARRVAAAATLAKP
jgi:uncharacterized protein (TIGR01244 family)